MRRVYGSPWWTSVKFGDCWVWTGAQHEKGYGRIRVAGLVVPVHRYVYEQLRGPIPTGLHLDHLCRNPACCRPAHLEPVTSAENTRRGAAACKDACVRGHEYDSTNTYRTPSGARQCRICKREAMKRFYDKAG